MDASHEILDAFVDGETVDPAALKLALADPAGRDYLIDAWLLRGMVQDEIATDVPPVSSKGSSPLRSWLIAASIAGVSLVSGYYAGAKFAGVIVPAAPITAPAGETISSAPAAGGAPAATRVIRLELDPNWSDGTGGR